MKIVTVIVTYNAMPWIDRCLTSLRRSSCKSVAVVIDNCSSDGTREYIPVNYPEVVWLPQEKNLGFGQGNNVGLRYAIEQDADYVLLLNQDAYLAPDALDIMISLCGENNIVTPMMLNGEGRHFDMRFSKSTLRDAYIQILEDVICGTGIDKSYAVGESAAACWLLPMVAVKMVGGFNPIFFHYGEDNNYFQRLQYHGFSNILAAKASVRHDRKVIGNQELYDKNLLRRTLINIFCDINLKKAAIIKQLLRQLCLCYYSKLLGKPYRIGEFTSAMFWICRHLNTIKISRRQERRNSTTWL